jgi:hypothetical protein
MKHVVKGGCCGADSNTGKTCDCPTTCKCLCIDCVCVG